MNLSEIEREALHLTSDQRAALAHKLLLSLDSANEQEISDAWLIEASRRAREIDEGLVQPVPAEAVRRKARSLLK